MLQGVWRNAHERCVGDAQDVTRLEFVTSTRGMTSRPEETKCSSPEGKSDWGSMSIR